MQARARNRIQRAEELVEVHRAQRVFALDGGAAVQLGAAVARRDFDVLLRQQRGVADARRTELVERRIPRRDPHRDDRPFPGKLDARHLTNAVTGDDDVGSAVDTVGIGEGGFDGVILPGWQQAQIEGKTEADVDGHGDQDQDQHARQRHDPGTDGVCVTSHQWPPLHAMRAGLTGSAPVKT